VALPDEYVEINQVSQKARHVTSTFFLSFAACLTIGP